MKHVKMQLLPAIEKSDLVELRIRPAGQEAEELEQGINLLLKSIRKRLYLDEEEEIGILALGGGALTLLNVVVFDVDTLAIVNKSCLWGASDDRAHHREVSCLDTHSPVGRPGGRLASTV